MNRRLGSCAAQTNIEFVSTKCRSLVKGAQIVAIPPHVTKTARGCVRVFEGWYTRRIENGFAFCNIVGCLLKTSAISNRSSTLASRSGLNFRLGWGRLQNRSLVQLQILSMRSEVRAQSLANRAIPSCRCNSPRFEGNPRRAVVILQYCVSSVMAPRDTSETPLWSVRPCDTGARRRTPRLLSGRLRCRFDRHDPAVLSEIAAALQGRPTKLEELRNRVRSLAFAIWERRVQESGGDFKDASSDWFAARDQLAIPQDLLL